jgi:hypothetical protein
VLGDFRSLMSLAKRLASVAAAVSPGEFAFSAAAAQPATDRIGPATQTLAPGHRAVTMRAAWVAIGEPRSDRRHHLATAKQSRPVSLRVSSLPLRLSRSTDGGMGSALQ